jgi:hypothetical protein
MAMAAGGGEGRKTPVLPPAMATAGPKGGALAASIQDNYIELVVYVVVYIRNLYFTLVVFMQLAEAMMTRPILAMAITSTSGSGTRSWRRSIILVTLTAMYDWFTIINVRMSARKGTPRATRVRGTTWRTRVRAAGCRELDGRRRKGGIDITHNVTDMGKAGKMIKTRANMMNIGQVATAALTEWSRAFKIDAIWYDDCAGNITISEMSGGVNAVEAIHRVTIPNGIRTKGMRDMRIRRFSAGLAARISLNVNCARIIGLLMTRATEQANFGIHMIMAKDWTRIGDRRVTKTAASGIAGWNNMTRKDHGDSISATINDRHAMPSVTILVNMATQKSAKATADADRSGCQVIGQSSS